MEGKILGMHRILVLLAFMSLLLPGCSSGNTVVVERPTETVTAAQPEETPLPTTPQTLAPTLELTPVLPQVCSPLAGVSFDRLADMIVNPYHPPKPGSDDPHQGVDLAQLSAPNGIALSGMVVQAVLPGKAAGLAADRFPYGNMLIIETPVDESLLGAIPGLTLPPPLPELLPPGALTCPESTIKPAALNEPRSLYVLYAHMQNPVSVEIGDSIACGQQIGAIGSSGNALNPHLHVEARIGPSGQTFESMAHYDPSASNTEMAAYCTWRVSGVFQTIDPSCLWGKCAP